MSRRHSVNRPPTPDVRNGDDDDDDEKKELTLQQIINIKLIESGEKARLMELARDRLAECGWKDEMSDLYRYSQIVHPICLPESNSHAFQKQAGFWAFIKKKGRNNVTIDDLIHVITPKGRASIPDSIKAELLQRIRSFLVSATL